MSRIACGALSVAALLCSALMAQVPSTVRADLAPTGTLRAGINYSNPVLAERDPATGELTGVAVALARELGRRLAVPVTLVGYDAAGKMTAALKDGAWDVAFLAVDPGRASEISFTAPYMEIEGTYLVPAGSTIQDIGDIDRDGVRVAISAGGTPDLVLSRTLTRAGLVRAPSPPEAIELFVADKLDAVAGVRQTLVDAASRLPGSRVLEGRFVVISQAAGVPVGRAAGAAYVRAFIEEAKASGLVARLLEQYGVGASIAPPAPPK
jgi:polar amino acid transport system substrate-binding protein